MRYKFTLCQLCIKLGHSKKSDSSPQGCQILVLYSYQSIFKTVWHIIFLFHWWPFIFRTISCFCMPRLLFVGNWFPRRGKCDNKIRTLYFHSIILNLCDEQSWNDTHYAIRIYSAHASGDLSASAKRSGKQHPLTQHYRAILGEQNKAAAAARVHAAERRIYCAISLSGEMKHSAVPGTHICKFRSLNVRVQWQSDVI